MRVRSSLLSAWDAKIASHQSWEYKLHSRWRRMDSAAGGQSSGNTSQNMSCVMAVVTKRPGEIATASYHAVKMALSIQEVSSRLSQWQMCATRRRKLRKETFVGSKMRPTGRSAERGHRKNRGTMRMPPREDFRMLGVMLTFVALYNGR